MHSGTRRVGILALSLALGACGSSSSDGSGGTSSGGASSGGTSSGGTSSGGTSSGGASSGGTSSGGSAGSAGSAGAQSFACGALATCSPGQYCEKFMGGACGGNPPDDGGTCPPNCSLTQCGSSSEPVCLCTGFQCKDMPSGCQDCSCLSSGGCSCSEDGGGVYVTCAAP